jgi:hypothetical protein
VIWAYDLVVEGSYKVFCWVLAKIQCVLALLHRPAMAVCRSVIDAIDGADEKEA